MPDGSFVKIAPLMRDPGVMEIKTPEKLAPSANGAMICGVDVGSTTVKYVLASPSGEVISQAYERHNTKQGEKVLQFLSRLEAQHGLEPLRDRFTSIRTCPRLRFRPAETPPLRLRSPTTLSCNRSIT